MGWKGNGRIDERGKGGGENGCDILPHADIRDVTDLGGSELLIVVVVVV